jgi:hypothetical protein
VRPVVAVLAATRSATVPGRFVPAFEGTVIHGAALAADQAHPFSVSTVTVTSPPAAETAAFAGVTLYRHGAASCDTGTSRLLMSSAACRGIASGFGPTR